MKYPIPVSRLVQRAALAAGLSTLPALSFAQGLPTIDPPSRGTGSGIMQTIRNYGYDMMGIPADRDR